MTIGYDEECTKSALSVRHATNLEKSDPIVFIDLTQHFAAVSFEVQNMYLYFNLRTQPMVEERMPMAEVVIHVGISSPIAAMPA